MIWRRLVGYLPASLSGGLASFGAVFVYSRLLSPGDYGLYALAMTTMGVIYTLSITWAEAAAYRFASEASARRAVPDHIRTILRLVAASAAMGVALLALALPFVGDPKLKLALVVAIAVMIAQPLVNAAQEMNRANQRAGRYSTIRVCQDVGSFSLGALLAWTSGLGPAAPFAGLATVLAVIAIVEGSRMLRASRGGSFQPADAKRYAGYGAPVALALALNIALDTGDRFMIALVLGPEAVGVYAAGYGVADKTIGLVCAWCAMAGAPMMLNAWEREGPAAMTQASAQLARLLLLVAAPAAAGLALVARPLSELMIGEAMRREAAGVMPWIALSGLANGFVLYYFSEAFQVSRRTGQRALLMAIPAIVNVGLNIILLPRVGLMGAVYATLACYALALVLLAVFGRRHARLALPWTDALKVAAACSAMAIALNILPAIGGASELMLKAGVGACVYAVVILLLDGCGTRGLLAGVFFRRARRA